MKKFLVYPGILIVGSKVVASCDAKITPALIQKLFSDPPVDEVITPYSQILCINWGVQPPALTKMTL